MLAALLLAFANPAHAGPPLREPLAREGEALGDAVVVGVVDHQEFERLTVQLPSGEELALEVTLAWSGTTTACVHDGLAVYPRFELTEGGEVDPAADPAIAALCARLEQRAPTLNIRLSRAEPSAPPEDPVGDLELPRPDARVWRPLHAVLIGLLAASVAALVGPARAALAALPKSAGLDLAGVALLGLIARLALSPRGVQIFPDAGFETLVMMWGSIASAHGLYGDGLTALHGPLQAYTGWDPEAAFGLHLALSALAPPLLWALARLATEDRFGALTAGVGMALLPVALRLAGSEVSHVPLATFELVAVLAAAGFVAKGHPALAVVAALATGFFAHLRPEAVLMTLLPLGLLAWGVRQHRARPAAVGAGLVAALLAVGLVAWRVRDMPRSTGAIRAGLFVNAETWIDGFTPQWGDGARSGAFQVFLDLAVTPFVLPAFALVGLVYGRRPIVAGCVIWWALTVLPVLPKAWPLMDAWRLQLAGQAPMLLLAALGVSALPRWKALAPAAVALASLPLLGMVREPWAGQVEWAFMPEALDALPDGATVLYPDHEAHAERAAQVAALLARRGGAQDVTWAPMTSFANAPRAVQNLFAWQDLTCVMATLPSRHVPNGPEINPCTRLAARCDVQPVAVVTLPARGDLDLSFLEEPAQVGLYRVDGCRP